MKTTITVKDAKIDNYTIVFAKNPTGGISKYLYGERQCGGYFTEGDMVRAIDSFEPRTDADRVAFVSKGRYDIQFSPAMETCDIYDNKVKDSIAGDFSTWTEAVDYLMDMEEL